VVGADNEDALVAVAGAREHGLLDRVALIGDPGEIFAAIDRCKVPLSPGTNPEIELVPIDPLAVDFEAKKESMAKVFHEFLRENPEFVVMKGSVDTGKLLHEALSIYKGEPGTNGAPPKKPLASHTALFVLPDGRFFALSDAGVNPGFRNADALLAVIENQLDVLRRVVNANQMLKVAIITAVEKETAAIPTTLLAAEAEAKAKTLDARYGPLVVEGPLSFDLATVPEVAEEKHYQGQIRGDANCLVATELNTANVLYKMLSKTMGSLGLLVDNGGILTAGPGTVPIVLTSRGDTARTKLNSILLALAYTAKAKEARAVPSVKAARSA
jgi:phosphate butyryltransferase